MSRQLEIRYASTLRSRLEDTLMLLDRIIELLTLHDIHGTRLLAIDILARSGSFDGCRGMPAVAGSDDDRVDVITLQHSRHVVVNHTVRVSIFTVR